MAYGNPGPMGGGGGGPVPGAMADEPMHDEGMHGEGGEGGQLHISADMLPPGMELHENDIVEFRVIGPKDADGEWPIEYNHGDEGKEGEGEGEGKDEGTSWEEDFRKSMSPRAGGGESQQEPM